MKTKIFLILFGVIFITEALAQNAEIKVIHRVRNDSVILRWAPTTAVAWQIANKYGYKVLRYELNESGDSLFTSEKTLVQNLKPWPLEEWEALANSDKYAAIAAQALYGEDFVVENPGDGAMNFYNQVSELENRFGFSLFAADMSLKVSQAMGLFLADVSFEKNKQYVYKVELQQNPSDYEVNGGANIIEPALKKELPQPKDPGAEFGDGTVKISWDTFYDHGIYIAYTIERSEDGGKTFITRNKVPFAVVDKSNAFRRRIAYLDSLDQNYKIYTYRLRGVTSFGETGPPSVLLQGAGMGSARGVTAVFDTSFVMPDGKAYLQWQYPEYLKNNLIGFVVCNSTKSKGPFEEISKLLSPQQTTFIHDNPQTVNYYVVRAIGRDSLATTSLPTLVQPIDSIPPSPPVDLKGKIDTTGLVYIDWKPNPESDIAGYRVFRSNSLSDEFMQITSKPVVFSEFRDSIRLRTLTEDVFYQVVAIDHRDNMSEYSKPLKLTRPDIVPPVSPAFVKFSSDENGISLAWINSSSTDVTAHELYRLHEGDTVVKVIEKGATVFNDTDIDAGASYTYILKARDEAGNYSAEALIKVQAYSSGFQPAVKKIRSKVDKEGKYIRLRWEYNNPQLSRFLIYRSIGEAPMRLYRSIEATAREFSDTSLAINNTYTYRIKAVFSNDDESELSEAVIVKY